MNTNDTPDKRLEEIFQNAGLPHPDEDETSAQLFFELAQLIKKKVAEAVAKEKREFVGKFYDEIDKVLEVEANTALRDKIFNIWERFYLPESELKEEE